MGAEGEGDDGAGVEGGRKTHSSAGGAIPFSGEH